MPIEPPERNSSARPFLGSITGNGWQQFRGAGRGSATRALWAGIRAAAEATGLPMPSFRDVNRARAWASGQAAAARNFQRAAPTESNWQGMIATVANSRGLAQRDAAPRYTARAQFSYMEGDEPVTSWVTYSLGSNLPPTVGDLYDQLSDIASQGMGDSPPVEAEFTGTAFVAAM